MPAYHLHRLNQPGGDPDPRVELFHADQAAMRWAIGAGFPGGCDIWQGHRYVGRVHGPSSPGLAPEPGAAEAGVSPATPPPPTTAATTD